MWQAPWIRRRPWLPLAVTLWLTHLATTYAATTSASTTCTDAPPATLSEWQRPTSYEAHYRARYNGFRVTAIRALQARPDGSWELRFNAESWLASLEERSLFRWQPGQRHLLPLDYSYRRSVFGRRHEEHTGFDWPTGQAHHREPKRQLDLSLPDAALDPLSYQLQLRHDLLNQCPELDYRIVDGRRIKDYPFAVTGSESLDTAVGTLRTLVVERVRDDEERITRLWLARDWDYLVVKLLQKEDNKSYEIDLVSAEVNGRKVRGTP